MVSLADIAKDPAKYKDQTFATTGKVTAVCQEMGCWMQLEDASGQAHVRMHGHHFFVPKTAPGHLARVQATLVPANGARRLRGQRLPGGQGRLGQAGARRDRRRDRLTMGGATDAPPEPPTGTRRVGRRVRAPDGELVAARLLVQVAGAPAAQRAYVAPQDITSSSTKKTSAETSSRRSP